MTALRLPMPFRAALAACVLAAMVLAAVLSACGSGPSSQAPASYAPGSPTIAAMNQKFDRTSLAGPAGKPFQLVLDNQDSAPHNVAIYQDPTYSKTLFPGLPIAAVHTVQVYDVPALAAGTYAFRCDVHPTTMTGTIVIGG